MHPKPSFPPAFELGFQPNQRTLHTCFRYGVGFLKREGYGLPHPAAKPCGIYARHAARPALAVRGLLALILWTQSSSL